MASNLEKVVKELGVENVIKENVAGGKSSGISNDQIGDYARYLSSGSSAKTVSNGQTTTETKTAMDMQKKKEDREEAKSDVNAAQIKKERAQKEYDDYVVSEEYKKRMEEQDIQQKQADIVKLFLPNAAPDQIVPKVIRDEKEERLRAARDQAEAEYNASEDQKVIVTDIEAITGLSEEERRQLEAYAVGRVRDQNQTLELQGIAPTAQQEAAELIQKYGRQRVDELAETYMRQQNADFASQVEEKARQQANEHGVLSSLATIPVNALSGVVGTVGQLQGAARSTGRYKTLDPNEVGTIGDTYSGAVRGQVQQNIEGEDPNFLRKAASIGYQGLMSSADSIARAYLGGGAFGGAALAATGSFSQTMAEASRRGATPAQAALLATTTAGIEALSEKIPLDNLIRTAKGGSQTVMEMVKTAFMQAGIEATTEEISLIGTVLADAAIMQEKSEYQLSITSKIMQGISPEQARDLADRELLDEAVNTALVSMASGGMSSLGGSAMAKYQENRAEAMANNPAVNQPKKGDAIKSRDALMQKYGQQEQTMETQETTQPQTEAQPVQKTNGELVQETVANRVREVQQQKQAAEAQTEQATQTEQQEQPRKSTADYIVESINNERAAKQNSARLYPNDRDTKQNPARLYPRSETDVQTTQTAQEPKNVQTERQTQAETTAGEQPVTAQQGSAPQADSQTVPDTASPVQQEQSAEGGQQQEQEETAPELQRDRINAVREQEIPVTDPQGGNVSEFVGNAYQSSLTPDSFTDSIKRLVEEGQVSHDVQTNEESLRKGAEMIAKAGTERQAVNVVRDYANSGKTSPEHIAMATVLYQDLTAQLDEQTKAGKVDAGLKEDAEGVFVSLQQMATNSGRALQLYNLFRKMSPDSQVRVMEKEVQRNIEKMQKAGTVKKDYQSSIDSQLTDMYREAAQEFQKAKGAEAKRAAEQKMQDIQSVIYAEEAAKLPTTFKAKWDAWRYMAMLGNAKTQVRNVAGNVLMMPYTEAKRIVGTILEKGIAKDQRTKAVFTDRKLMQWAKTDTVNAKSVLDGSAKLGDNSGGNPLADDIKTFGNSKLGSGLNWMQDKINDVVSGGDMLFKNYEYARSLAGFLKARGYTGADVQSNSVPVDVMNEARNYAVNEAMKATFNDSNMLSDFLANDLRYKGDNPIGKAVNMLGEGIMPFRKTPANVIMRFKDYSPAGLAQGVWNMAVNVRNGKVSAATALDQIASGLTGTAMLQLGYVLAGGLAGVKITGSGIDEDEERQGHQAYALEFSINGQEYSYKIDWAAPANLPLFLGANIREMQEAPDTASFLTAIANAGRGAFEPLLQLSCLSSLNDIFESARYADEGEALYTAIASAATSYFTQGIPALARQATQALTENKQTTFVTSDDPLVQDAQKTVAGLGVGNAYKTDKVNAWGEKEKQGEGTASLFGVSDKAARVIDAFANPGTLKKIDNSELEKEITRLNKSQEENVSPSYIPKTVSYRDSDGNYHENYRLSEEEYQKMAQTQGQAAREILEKMIEHSSYKAMDDDMKATAMQMVYSYAREKAMRETLGTTYSSSWMMGLSKGTEAGKILTEVAGNALNRALSNIKTARENNYSKENQAAYERELDRVYNNFKGMGQAQKTRIMETATGDTRKYLEVRSKGVTTKQYFDTTAQIDKLKPEAGYTTVRDIQTREAIANMPGLSDTAKDTLMKAYMTDYDPTDKSPQTTELKYDYARQELGLSPSEYTDVYRVQLDGGKKAEKLAEWQAMGYTRAEANMFYRLFAATGRTKIDVVEWYNG